MRGSIVGVDDVPQRQNVVDECVGGVGSVVRRSAGSRRLGQEWRIMD